MDSVIRNMQEHLGWQRRVLLLMSLHHLEGNFLRHSLGVNSNGSAGLALPRASATKQRFSRQTQPGQPWRAPSSNSFATLPTWARRRVLDLLLTRANASATRLQLVSSVDIRGEDPESFPIVEVHPCISLSHI